MFTTIVMIGITIGRITTGAVLLMAGISKIRAGRNRFLEAILGYDLVPEGVAAILARCLPWLEATSGLMLIAGFLSPVAVSLSFGLFLVFTTAITLSLIRGKENDCGCSNHIVPVQWRLVYRNIFFMGLLLPIYAFKGGAITIDRWATSSTSFLAPKLLNGTLVLFFLWGSVLIITFVLQRFLRKRIVRVVNPRS